MLFFSISLYHLLFSLMRRTIINLDLDLIHVWKTLVSSTIPSRVKDERYSSLRTRSMYIYQKGSCAPDETVPPWISDRPTHTRTTEILQFLFIPKKRCPLHLPLYIHTFKRNEFWFKNTIRPWGEKKGNKRFFFYLLFFYLHFHSS